MTYKIILGKNMTKQRLRAPRQTFETFDKAYKYGIGKWGSGSYRVYYVGELLGWSIETI